LNKNFKVVALDKEKWYITVSLAEP